MSLQQFNNLTASEAHSALLQCCSSEAWAERLSRMRPFDSITTIFAAADQIWQSLHEADFLQAFDGHPKIGDPDSLKEKYRNTHAMASGEQAGMSKASDNDIIELAALNQRYEDKFGFIFIICASGKSARDMLGEIKQRIDNDRQLEITIAAAEQSKITKIRLGKLLSGEVNERKT